jgi:hypothetical protein
MVVSKLSDSWNDPHPRSAKLLQKAAPGPKPIERQQNRAGSDPPLERTHFLSLHCALIRQPAGRQQIFRI